MKIPIAKPFLNEAEAQLAYDTILTNWVTQGPQVAAFEEEFAAYTGAKYAVAVSNCTTALHLSLVVAGVGPGDEVIVPSMSYIATANCVIHAGATPVFAEVCRENYNIDPADVRRKITSKTKAVIGVHQIGLPFNINEVRAICDEHQLVLIEDAACAAGSSYNNRKIGSHSDYVCFSFHPRKVITTGDGGMITTQNEKIAKRLKLLRQHGMSVNDRVRHLSQTVIMEEHVEVGYNYRLTDIQAAVGREQLKKLDWIIEERAKIANEYLQSFKDIACIELPHVPEHVMTNWQSFSIYIKRNSPISRNDLMQRLLDVGIATRRGVMTSHRELAFTSLGYNDSLPVSEDACDQSIILPLFVPMSQEEIDYVISHFKSLLGH
jgi:dTDP-4-amino-4,6-dideoxygalactose transaminase